MRTILLVGTTVVMLVAGQVLVKHGLNLKGGFQFSFDTLGSEISKVITSGYIWLGAAITIGSGLLWMDVLSKKDLSFVYPFISLTYVVSLLASTLIFREHVSALRWLGVAVICAGVYLVSRS